jgi:hypothetical protein
MGSGVVKNGRQAGFSMNRWLLKNGFLLVERGCSLSSLVHIILSYYVQANSVPFYLIRTKALILKVFFRNGNAQYTVVIFPE